MWAIRILSGEKAGKFYALSEGQNTIGRSQDSTIQMSDPGVSKNHLLIEVIGDKIIASDKGSRNGTFINGTKIQSQRLKDFDKIALSDIFIEIRKVPNLVIQQAASGDLSTHLQNKLTTPEINNFNTDLNANYHSPNNPDQHLHIVPEPNETDLPAPDPEHNPDIEAPSLKQKAVDFLEYSVMAGVYRLPQHLQFSWVLGLFMFLFIFLVTSLSTIPLLNILKESVEQESQQHALTIANNLAQINRDSLLQGIESSVSVDSAKRRPGVKDAYVLSNVDGSVIAPAHKAGSFPDIPFVPEARRRDKAEVSQVASDTVVAVVPIQFFNAETGNQTTKAHAVIVYDMASLSVDEKKTISLFVQTLFLALIIGSILFFFMYKLIEYPFNELNNQIDIALKENRSDLNIDYAFPSLQALISNVNSLLSRSGGSGTNAESSEISFERDRTLEMRSLVDLVGFPAIGIATADRTIGAANLAFEEKTRLSIADLLFKRIDAITDQALQLSLIDLLEKAELNPEIAHSNDLEFGGEPTQIIIQTIWGGQKPAYYLIVLLPEFSGASE